MTRIEKCKKINYLGFNFLITKVDKLRNVLLMESKRCLNKDYYECCHGQILYRLSSNYSLPALNSEQKKYSTEIIKA